MTDGRQHREYRFNHHAGVPCAAFADFHVGRIARIVRGSPVSARDDHLRRRIGRSMVGIPDHETLSRLQSQATNKPQMIEHKTQLGPNDPAPIRDAFVTQGSRTTPFAAGVNQFDAIRIGDAQQTRFGQEVIGPRPMRRQVRETNACVPASGETTDDNRASASDRRPVRHSLSGHTRMPIVTSSLGYNTAWAVLRDTPTCGHRHDKTEL